MIGVDVTPLLLERPRGVARALRGLLDGFARAERPVPVRLLAPRPPRPGDGVPPLDGVDVVPARSARAFRRAARSRARRLEAFVSPWLAAVRTDPQTIVWVHELPFVRLGPVEGRLRARRQRTWLGRHAAAGARFVVPSRATRDDLLTVLPAVGSRVSVIPHAFDPGPWRAARRRPDSDAYAVVVGTGRGAAGGFKKGMDLVPALAERLAPRLGVRVLGDTPVAEADLRRAVAGARVLVCPSRAEGFGFPPLEAMAAGVPVVSSDGGALPEIVGAAGLLVRAGDAEALAGAAHRAAFDPALRARLIERGHARAAAFPPAAAARAWLALLERAP